MIQELQLDKVCERGLASLSLTQTLTTNRTARRGQCCLSPFAYRATKF